MKKKIFEFAILLQPTAEEEKVGKGTDMLVAPSYILASDEKNATLLAGRKIPEEHLDKIDRIEVAVRPF